MNTLFTILAILALVGSVLITLIVLLQNSKGGGLASNFAAGNQTFGVRQTTDILEKITWGLAIFVLVVSVAASFTYEKKEVATNLSSLVKVDDDAAKDEDIQSDEAQIEEFSEQDFQVDAIGLGDALEASSEESAE